MFDNPFDSFHNTVAEAKRERDQLDRLLTISTSGERLLVVSIFILTLLLVIWLVFGNVSRSVAFDGVVLAASEENGVVRVLAWVDTDVTPNLKAGMPVIITPTDAPGGLNSIVGELQSIEDVQVSNETAALPTIALPVRPIAFAIVAETAAASLEGAECRIAVELGGQSPLNLFGMRLL